jgi:putative hydrolase of the HAD superfamily
MVLTSTLGTDFGKPHPKAFLDVEKHFGRSVQQYIYVADNPTKDFQAPKSLGWTTIRVRRHGGLYSSLEASSLVTPDFETTDLTGLTGMFARKELPF